mgnify:CR=1 FL=1
MKMNTLEKIYLALKEERWPVLVPENVAGKARKAIERMFELTA